MHRLTGPARRLEYANEAIGHCRMENLMAAGIVSSSSASVGVAADNGLFGWETRTKAQFSLTVQAGDGTGATGATGWSAAAHRSIDHLKIQERTLAAIDKAVKLVPKNADVRQFRSLILFATGNYSRAAEEAHDALVLGPTWTWQILGSFYKDAGHYSEQYRALERAAHTA